jgi:phage tail protein X
VTILATAQQDEPLDAICWRVLGTTAGGVVEQALTLNPGLARAALVAEGTPVTLPDTPPTGTATTIDTTNLWD